MVRDCDIQCQIALCKPSAMAVVKWTHWPLSKWGFNNKNKKPVGAINKMVGGGERDALVKPEAPETNKSNGKC